MPLKLTDNEIDAKFTNMNICRVGEYIRWRDKLQVKCLICNHVWHALPSNLFGPRHGCPNCSGNAKLDTNNIDRKLEPLNIKRIDDYANSNTPMKFECIICQHIWNTCIGNILRKGSGCPKCIGHIKLTNEDVDRLLVGRNIRRIGDYIVSQVPIEFECEICNHIWMARPNNILRQRGCPVCNKYFKNENLVNKILLEHGITFNRQHYLSSLCSLETKTYRVDFYITNKNTIIEYNGTQHYRPVRFGGMSKDKADAAFMKQVDRDKYLQEFCNTHNINLMIIDGRKYTDIKLEKYMVDNIIPLLKEQI